MNSTAWRDQRATTEAEIVASCQVLPLVEYLAEPPAIDDPKFMSAARRNDALPGERFVVLRWAGGPEGIITTKAPRPSDRQIVMAYLWAGIAKAAGWLDGDDPLVVGMPAGVL